MIHSTPVRDRLRELLEQQLDRPDVPGFVAGVWWDGQSFEASSGAANLNTGAPMTTDAGFILASVTKVVTTSMLVRFVDRGVLQLEDRVID
jgi:CubicO group peptidase (beta-lactamase class C family)